MNPSRRSASSSSLSTPAVESPAKPTTNDPRPLFVNESESGVEASQSSVGEEDEDADESRFNEPESPVFQRAVRTVQRTQEHIKKKSRAAAMPFVKDPSSDDSIPSNIRALATRNDCDRVRAMVNVATTSTHHPVMMSTSNSSGSDDQVRDIPTPSSGYEGDTEGAVNDGHQQPLAAHPAHRHHHHPFAQRFSESKSVGDLSAPSSRWP